MTSWRRTRCWTTSRPPWPTSAQSDFAALALDRSIYSTLAVKGATTISCRPDATAVLALSLTSVRSCVDPNNALQHRMLASSNVFLTLCIVSDAYNLMVLRWAWPHDAYPSSLTIVSVDGAGCGRTGRRSWRARCRAPSARGTH